MSNQGLKPRNKEHWTYTLSLGEKNASPMEASYLKRAFTIFLGQGGHFDYWGDPETGRVISVGVPEFGTRSTHFGSHFYWSAHRKTSGSRLKLTDAGKSWPKDNHS
jgi:hypothetical protein